MTNHAKVSSKTQGNDTSVVGPSDWNADHVVSPPILIYADGTGAALLCGIYTGTGSPNNVVAAKPGSLYLNLNGGAGTTLYVKESGNNTNTGWIGK